MDEELLRDLPEEYAALGDRRTVMREVAASLKDLHGSITRLGDAIEAAGLPGRDWRSDDASLRRLSRKFPDVTVDDLITRGAALPEIGVSGAVEDAVFALKAGETTGPISTENAVVVARVKERQDVNPAEMHTAREGIRNELLQSRRGQFFAAYMSKAKGKMKVEYNTEAIKALLGSM